MRQLIVKQLDYDLTPVAGLALVGHYLKALKPVLGRLDAALPVKSGVANSDIVRSYLGLLVQGKSDFDAIENFRGDTFFKQALGIGLLPSSPTRRRVFGELLCEKPLHGQWIARITAEYEAMLALNFETALALNRHEQGIGTPGLARLLAPLTKLACARQSIWAASELVESFGGAGYVEDTGIPRVLRNVHVHCIWEGTTSVLAHDVLRALKTPEAREAFLADIDRRLAALPKAKNLEVQHVSRARQLLADLMATAEENDGRRLAWGMARTYQAVLLLEAAAWRQARKADASGWTALRLFMQEPLVPPVLPASIGELAGLAFGAPVR